MPKWTPVQSEFTGSSRAMGSALDAANQSANAWTNLGKDLHAQEQTDELFARKLAEDDRKLLERKSTDILAKGLLEGPQTKYHDINDDVRNSKAFNYGNIGLFESKDAAGNTVYTDQAGGQGKVLSSEEAALRLGQQADIGKLLDQPNASSTETQSDMYQRVLSGVEGQGGVVTPEMAGLLQTARAADVTAADAKKKSLQELLAADEKSLSGVQKEYRDALVKAGVVNQMVNYGSTTEAETDQVANFKKLQDNYKDKMSGGSLGKAEGVANLELSKAEVIGSLDKLFSTSDAKVGNDVTKHMLANKINPELVANVLNVYTDKGLITNSYTAPSSEIIAAIDAAVEGDADKFAKAMGGPTRSSSTTVQDVRSVQSMNPAIAKQFKADQDLLLSSINARKAEITKLGLSGAAKERAEKESLSKDVQTILDRSLAKATNSPVVTTVLPAKEGKTKGTESTTPVSILSPAATGEGSGKTKNREVMVATPKVKEVVNKPLVVNLLQGLNVQLPTNPGKADSHTSILGNTKGNKNAMTDEEAMLVGGMLGVAAMPVGLGAAAIARVAGPLLVSKAAPVVKKILEKTPGMLNNLEKTKAGKKIIGMMKPKVQGPAEATTRQVGQATTRDLFGKQSAVREGIDTALETPSFLRGPQQANTSSILRSRNPQIGPLLK